MVSMGKNSEEVIDALVKHHFQARDKRSLAYVVTKHAIIVLSSVTITWLYIDPSIAYANGDKALAIQETITSLVSAAHPF